MLKPTLQSVSSTTSLANIIEIIDRDGGIIISDMLSSDTLRLLHDELGHELDTSQFCEGLFFGSKTKRIHGLAGKSAVCRSMIMDNLAVEIANTILGPACDKIQLNLTQGIQIWPGERAQLLHRDHDMFPMRHHDYETMINFMWAHSDFTVENGGTIVVPGSHKWSDSGRISSDNEKTQAVMKAGDLFIYLGSTIHAGGANRTCTPRTGIVISYCLGWLRQSENQYLAVPPQTARHFSKELQDMLGYTVHRPNLGMYEGCEPRIAFDMPNVHNIITRDWLLPQQNEIIKCVQHIEDNNLDLSHHVGKFLPQN